MSLPSPYVLYFSYVHLVLPDNIDFSFVVVCNQGFCTTKHVLAYRTEDCMALNIDTPLIFNEVMSEIVLLSIYITSRKRQKTLFNGKKIVLHCIALHEGRGGGGGGV